MKALFLFLMCISISGCALETGNAEIGENSQKTSMNPVIEIDPDNMISRINPLVFGTNMIGYDPTTYEVRDQPFYGYSNYGAGVWNPELMEVDPAAATHAKEAGATILRFPGGCGTHQYDWKRSIGPVEDRPNFQYGLDEFMQTCETLGSRAVITLSYYIGSAQDSADLVEYLNSPDDGSNPGGGVEWASIRAANGHPAPYGVTYFEYGNEEYHGNHRDIKKVSGTEYGLKFVEHAAAMKKIDPSIRIGAVTISPDLIYYDNWTLKVIETAGQYIDFFIEHTYNSGKKYFLNNEKATPDKIEAIYREALDGLPAVESYYRKLSRGFGKLPVNKKIPIAISEYNGHFIRESPYPYRHALGTALFNAGLIQIFMRPENNVLMANYWQFYNSYWGMIKNEALLNGSYGVIKRPNFLVMQLLRERFGKKLVGYRSDSRDLIVSASISEDGKKIYLMVINKDMKKDISAKIIVQGAALSEEARAWAMNGPTVDATNETVENVKIESYTKQLTGGGLDFFFQPHSLTFIELDRV